jgi:Type I phosphodiesterase / nucleotide pyrophosphatase
LRATRWTLGVLAAACITAAIIAGTLTRTAQSATATSDCSLANGIKHVIYLQFDNTHYRRDNPNVASDLEQMPHLLDFMQNNGTLFTNDHTILISHTAGGILSSLTGLYPDRTGITVSNSYDYYKNNGFPAFTSAFKYWTVPVDGADDSLPNMITDTGKTTPAPWVTYTRAGCDVGGVSTANMVFEANSDVAAVYGPNSPENAESSAKKTTDFIGIAVHCSQNPASICNNTYGALHAKDDLLPDEPGGYTGYRALFGAKYVNPAITGGSGCVQATDGSNIVGSGATGCGFPGFDGALAKNTLGEVQQMQENGVPVTFAYISDAHDNHTLARASGPGEADYKQQLADYDAAFQSFFSNLASHGIDKSNTLFVITVDEGDHFAGAQVTPDASGTATYSHTACPQASLSAVTPCAANQIGEVNAKIGDLLPAGEPGFDIHFDDAPTFYVNGQPSRTDSTVRKLEQDVWNARAPDPYENAVVPIAQFLADPVEEKTLHMVNADPKRTPTFTMFGNPDFFFQTTNLSLGCAGSSVCVNPGFAWNHGDVQQEIGNTWVGFVGPGIASNGVDSSTWTDHTNLRPTINALVGLNDDYTDDGHVLREALNGNAVPAAVKQSGRFVQLSQYYEQVNAPFGQFALDTLKASTKAVASSDDSLYSSIESQIQTLTSRRDALAAQMRSALNGAAFGGTPIANSTAGDYVSQAKSLLQQAASLASS